MIRKRIIAGACLAAVLALLTTTAAIAQQRTIYGSDGRVQSRTHTDSAGNVTIYGADGRVTGRILTDSQGKTTIYGAGGHRIGTTSKPTSK